MADHIQHGIDDNPNNDAEKGATLGGIGGAVTGLAAGSVAGPVGAVLGAIIGGVAGAAASGAAVAAVDRVDNDNTITGLGGTTNDLDADDNSVYATNYNDNVVYDVDDNGGRYYTDSANRRIYTDETGRYYHTDITSGERVYVNGPGNTGLTQRADEPIASIKTGGYANDGTPDTRGAGEKLVDAVTGDVIDDKTGKVVNHP